MIILGLLCLIAAVVVGFDLVLSNRHHGTGTAHGFGTTVAHVSVDAWFVAGIVCGFVLMLGIALLIAGLRRRARMAVTGARRRDAALAAAAAGESPTRAASTAGVGRRGWFRRR